VPYDADLLAAAARYQSVAVAGALWSLGNAAVSWVDAVEMAADRGVVLVHPSAASSTSTTWC